MRWWRDVIIKFCSYLIFFISLSFSLSFSLLLSILIKFGAWHFNLNKLLKFLYDRRYLSIQMKFFFFFGEDSLTFVSKEIFMWECYVWVSTSTRRSCRRSRPFSSSWSPYYKPNSIHVLTHTYINSNKSLGTL